MPSFVHSVHVRKFYTISIVEMTIFSGVVAILSPSFMSRLPTRPSNKTKSKGPVELGEVLEKMQQECGVACTRTSENVCMVQGEWDAIRMAYSFLDGRGLMNGDPQASAPPIPRATKAGNIGPTVGPTYTVTRTGLALVENCSTLRQPQEAASKSLPSASSTVGQGGHTQVKILNLSSIKSESERSKADIGNNSPGRSGAMKRKQGKPRRQVQSLDSAADLPVDSSSDVDIDNEGEIQVNAPNIARDTGGFANGDSSIQIVAAWGNFKEENIDEMSQQNKFDGFSSGGTYGTGKRSQIKQENLSGLYTWGDDAQGNPVMIPAESSGNEPVYILNVDDGTETFTKDVAERASCSYGSPTVFATTVTDLPFKNPKKPYARKGLNQAKGGMATARKSTTQKLLTRKASTQQRTVYIVAKKSTTQATQKTPSKKKGKTVSPRRRGIIQGKAASANMMGQFTCSYCQKQFSTMEAIHVHEEVYHTGRYKGMPSSSKSPLFECNQCGKSYMSKHALEEHMYTHVGMRPFGCPYCAASFNHRKSLRRHVQLHNDHESRRFDCPHCAKRFTRKDALESHLRVHKLEMDEME